MANSLYGKTRERFARGLLNWDTLNVRLILVDTGNYTLSIDTHEFLSDIPVGAIFATSSPLVNLSSALGACDADDLTLYAVYGPSLEAAILYIDTGVPATSRLLVYMDVAIGLTITPNGGDIRIIWNNDDNKIFRV